MQKLITHDTELMSLANMRKPKACKIYLAYPRDMRELQVICLRAQVLLTLSGIISYVPPADAKKIRKSKRGWMVVAIKADKGADGTLSLYVPVPNIRDRDIEEIEEVFLAERLLDVLIDLWEYSKLHVGG